MTIVIDQANIGEAGIDSSATTIPFTTSQTVAAGATISVQVTWGNATVTLTSVTGGSLTWTIDKQSVGGLGNQGCAFVRAPAPAGLVSGTVLTANYSAATVGRGISGTSLLGVDAVSPLDTSSGPTDFNSTTAWTTASTAIAAGSILLGLAHCSSTNDTSTITSPSIEAHDFGGGAGTFGHTVGYRIETSGGSFTVAGTWSGSEIGTTIAVAYKAAVAAAAAGRQPFNPLPLMSNGRI